MKALLLTIVAAGIAATSARSETITVGGRTLTLPDSKVAAALRNPRAMAEAQALLSGRYEGTAKARQAKRLIAKLNREGPTDENLAMLVELKKASSSSAPPRKPPVKMNRKRVAFNAAIARGFDTGLGFILPLEDENRNDYTQLTVLVSTALQTGAIDTNTPQSFNDIDGKSHTLKTAKFLRLMFAYGSYYKGLRDQLRASD